MIQVLIKAAVDFLRYLFETSPHYELFIADT